MPTDPVPTGPAEPEPLVRRVTVLGLWALVVNGTVGAGIFGLPARAAELTGIHSPLVLLLCGVLLLPVVLSFAEVASHFRGTGGPILYAHTAFGPMAGFQTGWAFYVARLSASAANVNLLVAALGWFWTGAGEGAVRVALLLLVCTALTWVNVAGSAHAMRSVGVLTVLKFLPLLLLVAVGLPRLGPAAFPLADTPLPAARDLGSAVLLLVYAYVGWESALVPAGEARHPDRDMPRALLWGLGMVLMLYVVLQAVCVAVVPDLARSTRPLVDAGAALLGPTGAAVLTLGVIASVGGNVASATFSTPRITYAMAREGLLPSWFGTVHAVYRTPIASVLLYGGLTFGLAAVGSFAWLAEVSVLTRLLIYLMGVLAAPRLRGRAGVAPAALRLPGGAAIPLLGALVCVGLGSQVSLRTALVTAVFLGVGSLLFVLARRERRRRG